MLRFFSRVKLRTIRRSFSQVKMNYKDWGTTNFDEFNINFNQVLVKHKNSKDVRAEQLEYDPKLFPEATRFDKIMEYFSLIKSQFKNF